MTDHDDSGGRSVDATEGESRRLDRSLVTDDYPGYEGQVETVRTREARDGEFVAAGTVLPDDLAADLGHDLYAHQAAAIESLRNGENVVVATSTASGKTLVYALYVALLKRSDPDARAILTFPTKALARDQERQLTDLYDRLGLDVAVGVYDGDTPRERRREYRRSCDVLLTNFAGVNAYLHDHHLWADAFANCALLVVDEAHTYTGVHGMHVAWTIRRLRRLLYRYGADPRTVCTTATIGNPAEHARHLVGTDHVVVDDDGSPRGRREIVLWDPPVDEMDVEYDYETYRAAKTGAAAEAASVTTHLAKADHQSIAFARSRQGTEIAAKRFQRLAGDHPRDRYVRAEPYHAGHGKATRREIEARLGAGELDAVFATTALELGIDVGSVDAAVLAGYPGTRQSFWQRIGRAGRGRADALGVLVARADAIDQYVLDHPSYLFDEGVEDAVIDLDNNVVYAQHVLAAADEAPLTGADRRWFGDRLPDAIAMWRDAGRLVGDLDRGVQYDGRPRPQGDISIYAAGDDRFDVRGPDGIDAEPIERSRAYRDFHEGARLLLDGTEYEVVEFVEDATRRYVRVEPTDGGEYTITQSEKAVGDLDPEATVDAGDIGLRYGTGTVSVHHHSYQHVDVQTGERTGVPQPTGLDPIDLRTGVAWVELPADLVGRVAATVPDEDRLDPDDVPLGVEEYTTLGGLHGAEHAMIKLAPVTMRMDKSDLGGLSTLTHPTTGEPAWFVHDAVEGGIGFARGIYDRFETLARETRDHVADCDCTAVRGCPGCLMDDQCGSDNAPLHTTATVAVLDLVLDALDRSR
ncbi:helicase [Halobacteriales archaeon SW_7_68_16]|nr:MAG: helicase [Halobacteriales archaeon SW_7_68_16]